MARCEHCGNEYDKSFTVTMDEQSHTFDSFECAIATLAPRCAHCDCAIIGHGVEAEGAGAGEAADVGAELETGGVVDQGAVDGGLVFEDVGGGFAAGAKKDEG